MRGCMQATACARFTVAHLAHLVTLLLCFAGSYDRSLRRWERTSEPFFVEEETERLLVFLFCCCFCVTITQQLV
jgi:hypothetical protein